MTETLLNGVLLFAVVGVVSGLARRLDVVRPILLLVVGTALSYVPGVLDIRLDPSFVLTVLLPLLLYSATLEGSVVALRKNVRTVGWLAIGHVIFITALVGVGLHLLVPAMPLVATFALGAVIAPPDAVSATAVARRVGLPRRVVTILEGESLFNDAAALVLVRVVIGAAAGAVLSWWEIGLEMVLAAAGGALAGWIVGVVAAFLHRRTNDPLLDNTIGVLMPFLAFLPAEHFHASGVVAVVVCGLYVGHRRPELMSAESRLQMQGFWKVVQFLLEGMVFVLVGLQIRLLVDALISRHESVWTLVVITVGVPLLAVLGRFAWVALGFGLRLLKSGRRTGSAKSYDSARAFAVISWAGMRGVVTLAAAMTLPATFPDRELVVWGAFVVIVVTLVFQGWTLPVFVRRVGLTGDDRQQDLLVEAEARQAAFRAASDRLTVAAAPPSGSDGAVDEDDPVVRRLRVLAENRAHHAWERLGDPAKVPPSERFRRLRREMIEAEREVFVAARDAGRLPDDVLRRVQYELDLEEMMISRERGE